MLNCPLIFGALLHGIPYGLAVRIPGFHPGGPGSTPGMGRHAFGCTNFAGVFIFFYQAPRLVKLNPSE